MITSSVKPGAFGKIIALSKCCCSFPERDFWRARTVSMLDRREISGSKCRKPRRLSSMVFKCFEPRASFPV
jgi:hypothetical protein